MGSIQHCINSKENFFLHLVCNVHDRLWFLSARYAVLDCHKFMLSNVFPVENASDFVVWLMLENDH